MVYTVQLSWCLLSQGGAAARRRIPYDLPEGGPFTVDPLRPSPPQSPLFQGFPGHTVPVFSGDSLNIITPVPIIVNRVF